MSYGHNGKKDLYSPTDFSVYIYAIISAYVITVIIVG